MKRAIFAVACGALALGCDRQASSGDADTTRFNAEVVIVDATCGDRFKLFGTRAWGACEDSVEKTLQETLWCACAEWVSEQPTFEHEVDATEARLRQAVTPRP